MNPIEKPKILIDYYFLKDLNQPSRVRSPTNDYITRPHMLTLNPTFTRMEGVYTHPRESIDGRPSALASRIDVLEFDRYF